jgi:hypothetical protein
VITTAARDAGRAAAGFLDDVAAGRLTHAGHPDLDAAVAGARRRPIGDGGLFGWDRHGATFIAPLVAASLARFGAVTVGRRTGNAMFA